jgi:hypothetical protein
VAIKSLDDLTVEERLALSYCAPHGVPLSVFLGRVVGLGDPQWHEEDAQAAVLWQIEQNVRCTGCGQPRSECMGPEDDAPDYEVTITRCWACEARDAKSREFQEDGASSSGIYMSVAKVVSDGDI